MYTSCIIELVGRLSHVSRGVRNKYVSWIGLCIFRASIEQTVVLVGCTSHEI